MVRVLPRSARGALVLLGLSAASVTSTSFAACPMRLESLTSVQVAQSIAGRCKTAIVPIGSTEQHGDVMPLGKHNLIAAYLAAQLATELGDAIIFPVIPLAPTGDPLTRSGHMAHPGSISLRMSTYRAVVEDVVLSALASGFTRVLIYGDHGEGQDQLAAVASEFDAATQPQGVRILHLSELYADHRIAHAGPDDAAMYYAAIGSGAPVEVMQHGRQLLQQRLAAALKRLRALESGVTTLSR